MFASDALSKGIRTQRKRADCDAYADGRTTLCVGMSCAGLGHAVLREDRDQRPAKRRRVVRTLSVLAELPVVSGPADQN